jgi:hypothetical protein
MSWNPACDADGDIATLQASIGHDAVLVSRRAQESGAVFRRFSEDLLWLHGACKSIRTHPELSRIPLIFLTARASETDRIVGLELGASDYIVKPFYVCAILTCPLHPQPCQPFGRSPLDANATVPAVAFGKVEYYPMASPGAVFTPVREKQLEGFLKAELDFGFTLATIATDLNPHAGEHYGRRKRTAAAAVATVHHLTDSLTDSIAKVEILARCFQLERLVASL